VPRDRLARVTNLDAAYFDGWYADKLDAGVIEAAKRRCLNHPSEFCGTSFLTLDGVTEVGAGLGLAPGRRLLDLACGVGAFGCWLTKQSGCDLVGVDFSSVAVERARWSAVQVFDLRDTQVDFRVGELTMTGLPAASVDAVMVIDSIQFAAGADVTSECLRVLQSGGRIALTGWEPINRNDPVHSERMRNCDLGASLATAGFVDIQVDDRPEWLAAERACWQEIIEHDPATHPALPSAIAEGRRSLANWGTLRRVYATATRP
jgi:SAM-dependent methyltransferase